MNLVYRSTRNGEETASASEAILKGLTSDGGLFVPDCIPKLGVPLGDLAKMSYQEIAYAVMKEFLTDFTEEEAAENETTEQLAIPDTLLKEQPTELETSNAPAAIADTSTVQSTAKNDTLYPKNEEQKTSDNHAAHKHKDTLTGTEQPRHTHKEKATQETENRSKSHNRALQEKSRAPRHESQSDGTQTTKL